jgi:hypothetical protein
MLKIKSVEKAAFGGVEALLKGGPGSGPHPGGVKAPKPGKGTEIHFSGKDGQIHVASVHGAKNGEVTDKHIDRAKAQVEAKHGALPKDSRTDYPSFTIYHRGEEMGGG